MHKDIELKLLKIMYIIWLYWKSTSHRVDIFQGTNRRSINKDCYMYPRHSKNKRQSFLYKVYKQGGMPSQTLKH